MTTSHRLPRKALPYLGVSLGLILRIQDLFMHGSEAAVLLVRLDRQFVLFAKGEERL